MLTLKVCPDCGELYDTSTHCNSDKCRTSSFDKRMLIENQIRGITKQLPAGSITFGTFRVISNDEARHV